MTALRLLHSVSIAHLRRHRLRTWLTIAGIALGVAVITSIAIVNRTLNVSFQRTIDLVAGKAVLQVVNAESGIRESLYPVIRDTRGVEDAAPVVQGFLPVAGIPGERLFVYGVDLLTDSFVRDYEFVGDSFDLDRALTFIARPDSIALTESAARRMALPLGSTVRLGTSRGVDRFTVRALLREQGPAKVFGGSFALMDLPVAQMVLGKEGKIDLVDVTLQGGEDVEEIKGRIAARLGGAARVERPRERGEQIESLLTSFRVGLFFVSFIALFVGFFLIYNTISISVVQRRREIGTLRCLGLLRRDVLGLLMFEALLMALLGSLAGVLFGLVLAKAAVVVAGQTVSNLYLQVDLQRTAFALRDLWVGLGSGLGVSLLAALLPAREAMRVSPLENYRRAAWTPRSRVPLRASVFGMMLLVVSLPLWLYSPPWWSRLGRFSLGMTAALIFLLALSFLSPFLVLGSARLARLGTRRLSWIGGRLGLDHLIRSPVRCGITVATLMISLASIFTIAAFIHSVRGSLLTWVDQMVTADLIVSSGARTAGPMNVPLREELAGPLGALPGVRILDLYRLIRSTYGASPILIESFSARASGSVRNLPMAEGDGRTALRGMAEGAGVIVSESFNSRFGKGTGDRIELATPSGLKAFRILGVYVDYSSDSGSILIDRSLYKQLWGDDLVDAFDLWLEPGADERGVIEAVKRGYGEKFQLFISTHRELRDAVAGIMEQSFRVNYAVLIVAVVVALLGVINTLLASVLDRSREIGVLRAIGATGGQIKSMVVAEAGWMGLVGGVLGLASGTVISYHHVAVNTKVLTGWTFQFYYPYGLALACLVLGVGLCLVAAYLPARKAASTNVVAAVGYE
ncbi:MAG TPA: FtsX-like permease family protein [Candidatus Binatia bacterium]